jgi:hypothetical protein
MPTLPSEQYNLDPGVDYTALFAGYASALEQGIQLAQPNSIRGFILYQEDMPQTVGTYPGGPPNWFEQNLRFGWTKPSTGAFHVYRAGVGYENVATKIPINTITTAMLQDHSVTPIKLWAPNNSAQAGWSFVLDAGGVNWLIADLIAARPDKSIAIAKLQPSTTDLDFIRTIGGNTVWAPLTAAQINTILKPAALGLLDATVIDVSPYDPLSVARVNITGDLLEFVDPAQLIGNNSVPIVKLSPGVGNAGKYIGVNATGDTVVYITPPVIPTGPNVTVFNNRATPLALPAGGANSTVLHALAGKPQLYTYALVCITADAGWSVFDEIPIAAPMYVAGSGNEVRIYTEFTTPTTCGVTCTASVDSRFVPRKSDGLLVLFTPANWSWVVTAEYLT